MQSFDKQYIIAKLNELKTHLDDFIHNRKINLVACRELFTNDFAFYCFQKLLYKLSESVVMSQIQFITHATSNNAFLVCKNWLFGINDDGKIFTVYLNSRFQTLKDVYQNFGYSYDILDDCIRNKVKFNGNRVCLKFDHRSLKYYDSEWIRVCGDLMMQYESSDLITLHFKELLELYINELWMQRLSEHGIMVFNSGKPYVVYAKRDLKMKKLLLDELINALKLAHCDIINHQELDCDNIYLDSTLLVCKFSNFTLNVFLRFDSITSGYYFNIAFSKSKGNGNGKRLDFVKNVLKTIGINPDEQNIVLNLGNHKIILNGYYFPMISVGTSLISIDRYFATKVLLQHPEHHDIEIIFPDLVSIEFDTIRFERSHQMLRNEYFVKQKLESS